MSGRLSFFILHIVYACLHLLCPVHQISLHLSSFLNVEHLFFLVHQISLHLSWFLNVKPSISLEALVIIFSSFRWIRNCVRPAPRLFSMFLTFMGMYRVEIIENSSDKIRRVELKKKSRIKVGFSFEIGFVDYIHLHLSEYQEVC